MPVSDTTSIPVGTRIRRARLAGGLSLEVVAGLAGITKGYLSRLERGERPLDSRSLLIRIADALGVPAATLSGDLASAPDPTSGQSMHQTVDAVRLALLEPDRPGPAERSDIVAGFARLAVLTRACDLAGQARVVPELLAATQRRADARGSRASHQGVVLAAYAASELVRNLGSLDLALIAAQRMQQACEELDDPAWLAFAAYAQAHALWPAGAWRAATTAAGNAADELTRPAKRSGSSERDASAARGACLLVAAFASSGGGDIHGARARLSEAGALASGPLQGVIAAHTSFSPANVALHRLAVEVQAGDPAAGLSAVEGLDLGQIGRDRQSYYWIDVGRAWTRLERPRQALGAFRRAEQAAALRVRLSPVVRVSVQDLLERAHPRSTDPDLRGLAERCGALSA